MSNYIQATTSAPTDVEEHGAQQDVVPLLEEFFKSPAFSEAVGAFMGRHVQELEFKDPDEEQPLKNHAIYQEYTKLVEQTLEAHLGAHSMTVPLAYQACKRSLDQGNSGAKICVSYLLASTEYPSFMQLAHDHTQLCTYNPTGFLTEMWDPQAEGGELQSLE